MDKKVYFIECDFFEPSLLQEPSCGHPSCYIEIDTPIRIAYHRLSNMSYDILNKNNNCKLFKPKI